MRSLSPAFLSALRLGPAHISSVAFISAARGRQDLYLRRSPEALETLRKVALVESNESSNRIEGITASRERLEAIVLRSTTPRNRSEEEILGYRNALALIHESHEHMNFSTNVILQLHSMLLQFIPGASGRWKATNNEVVERDHTGAITRVRFRAVPAVATPQAMEDLVSLYALALDQRVDALIAVPLAILDFLCIHPFSDGNGRMSRLLTLQLLYRSGFEVGRYISLERIVEQSKETYYEVLEHSSQKWHEASHDPLPWLEYFWGVLIAAHKELQQRVDTLTTGIGSKSEAIRNAVQRRFGPFAASDILRVCPDVSPNLVGLVLRQMRDEGTLTLSGKGRGAKWLRKL